MIDTDSKISTADPLKRLPPPLEPVSSRTLPAAAAHDVQSKPKTSNHIENPHRIPLGTELCPFGSLTVVHHGYRLYLSKDPITGKIKWCRKAPTTPQTWVLRQYPATKHLPKMKSEITAEPQKANVIGDAKEESKEQINDFTTFHQQIDKINENAHTQTTWPFPSETPGNRGMSALSAMSRNEPIGMKQDNIHQALHRDMVSVPFPYGMNADIQPFHFVYDGMHGHGLGANSEKSVDNPLNALIGTTREVNGEDSGQTDLKELMDTAWKQDNVKPIDNPKGMKIKLFKHQKKGVAWMLKMEEDGFMNGGLLGDQMGVGKTIQIIALMKKSRDNARKRAKEQWNKKGHLDTEDEEVFDDEDSNDETLNGFVVGDNEVDYQSGHSDANLDNQRIDDDQDSDWSLEIESDTDLKSKKESASKLKEERNLRKRLKRKREESTETNTDNSNWNTMKSEYDDVVDAADSVYKPDSGEETNDSDTSDILARPLRRENKAPKTKTEKKEIRLYDWYLTQCQSKKRRKLDDTKKANLYSFFDSNSSEKRRKQRKRKRDRMDYLFANDIDDSYHSKPWLYSMKRQRTLIIGPLAIMDQWAEEIEDKCPGQFVVVIYYGPGRRRKWNKRTLRDVDVVITTYVHFQSHFT